MVFSKSKTSFNNDLPWPSFWLLKTDLQHVMCRGRSLFGMQ